VILGMSTATYTFVHVLISLVGIGSGFIVMFGLLTGKRLDRWTVTFLITTALTSISGFFFPNDHVTPGIILGIISLAVLALAIPARYMFHLAGAWRSVYVIGAVLALYFNVFVLVAQCFEKIPALKALAPTQKEPPFLIAQLLVLLLFATITVFATVRFHPERVRTA
jgi:hypothetical protein